MVFGVELVCGWPEAGRARRPQQRAVGWHLPLFVRIERLRKDRRLRLLPGLAEGRPPPCLLLQGKAVHRRYRNQEGERDHARRALRPHGRDARRRVDLSGPADSLLLAGHYRSGRLDAASPVTLIGKPREGGSSALRRGSVALAVLVLARPDVGRRTSRRIHGARSNRNSSRPLCQPACRIRARSRSITSRIAGVTRLSRW
jgi:hypothetical protein